MLASRRASWLRDTLTLSAMAPRLSRPIWWNVFLPVPIPGEATGDAEVRELNIPAMAGPATR